MPARYFVEALSSGELRTIDGSEAHHMTNVMRLKTGDQVSLFDGQGRTASATLSQVGKRELRVTIGEIQHHAPLAPPVVTAAIALPKGERSRFIVEKMTELGVHELIPLIAARSVVKTGRHGLGKLRRYVIESCKQCERNYLMGIGEEKPFATVIQQLESEPPGRESAVIKVILDPDANESLNLAALSGEPEAITFAIGPEGGWTEEERQLALAHGWQLRKLGELVLRTETAAIAAAALSRFHAR